MTYRTMEKHDKPRAGMAHKEITMINTELVAKTEAFLKETFANSAYMQANPADCAYRLEHSYRVANIGREIAVREGFDPTEMVIACLLHDISYCQEFGSREAAREHGRLSARIARPFLNELGLSADRVNDICYGIAIHVDDAADFEGQRTAFAETVSDADNIDRFDAYRIYETLHWKNFRDMNFAERMGDVSSALERLPKLREMKLGTKAAVEIWQQRIDYYISFYERLKQQLENSTAVI